MGHIHFRHTEVGGGGGAISFHPFKGGHEKFYSVSRENAKQVYLPFVALPPHN